MLSIEFGRTEDAIYNTALFFKNQYDPEWLKDGEVQEMIANIDKSKVLSSGAIESPVLGVIPPQFLSGGVKTLILIKKMPDFLFNASQCGDNCAPWLLRFGKEGDETINLRHLMNFGSEKFDICIVNTGEIVHDMYALAIVTGRFV